MLFEIKFLLESMKTILVVDDEKTITDVIRTYLIESYKIVCENSGRKALEIIEKTDLDLVITDMVMPEVDGIALLSFVKKTRRMIPVLIMSGDPIGLQFLSVASMLGAAEKLCKPFTKETILLAVEKAIGK